VTVKEPPQRTDPDPDAASRKSGLYLGKRDVAILLQHRHDLLAVDFGL
jgi:hypothetical protein